MNDRCVEQYLVSMLVLLYFDGDERAGCILLLTVNTMRLLVF